MKLLIPLLTALLCTAAALADVARPVLQSSTTKALVDDLATGGKKMTLSATGTLEFVSGATITGGSVLKSALSLNNVENTALSTWAGSTNITTINPAQSISKLSNLTGNGFVKTSAADGTLVIDSNTYITSSTAIATFQVKYTNLDSFGNLANAAGFLFNNGTGTLSYVSAVPVANGGTGQTSYTNGQILIGNTTGNTLTKATLTAGAGISITNGAGSITIATSGLVIGTDVQAYDADLSTYAGITPGTGVATALGNAVNAASGLLTHGGAGAHSSLVLGSTSSGTTSLLINVSLDHYTAGSPRPIEVSYWTGSYALRLETNGDLSSGGSINAATNVAAGNAFYFPAADLLMQATSASDTGNAYTFAANDGSNLRQIKARSLDLGGTVSGTMVYVRWGAGSPEGVLTAPVGSLYLNQSGGSGTTLYIKESGTGNTGWIGK